MDRREHDDPAPTDADLTDAPIADEPDEAAARSPEPDDSVEAAEADAEEELEATADEDELDDDEDELDDDDDDDEPDDEAPDPAVAPRRSLGPTLIGLGAGVWAIAAALHCGAPPAGPSLSVTPQETPAESVADSAEAPRPEPGSAEPEPADAEARPEPEPASDAEARPDVEDDPEDEPMPLPEVLPEDWATDLDPPSKVAYTIRRGGSIKNVANLFKIFHHEITALNPGVTLEQELPPNSKVVVYLAEDSPGSSESVGLPSSGTLEGAIPMVEGPGRQLKAIPWKSWGTAHTVALLDRVLRQWGKRGKGVQPILVGNMSARKGGKLEPHSTHQSGRDVDLSYPQKLPKGEELNWRTMTKDNLDAAETWALMKLLRSTGQVEVIFIDSSIQKLLYDYAVAQSLMPKSELSGWLEYPRRPPQRRALVQHVKGHVDHMHVRFSCQPHESRCKSRQR